MNSKRKKINERVREFYQSGEKVSVNENKKKMVKMMVKKCMFRRLDA
jgi:hypothetical protein